MIRKLAGSICVLLVILATTFANIQTHAAMPPHGPYAKRLHYFEQLFHAVDGWLAATSENMVLHVDMAAKKTANFPDAVAARLARMKAAHASLPPPESLGRRITMPRKA